MATGRLQEFIHYIADAVTEKVAGITASSDFISILSDGSQARKTGSEKEMVLSKESLKERLIIDYIFNFISLSLRSDVIFLSS